MKKIIFIALSLLALQACKKDKITIDYTDGVSEGEEVTINEENVDGTLNVDGGTLTIEGETSVTADLNIDQEKGGEIHINDNVTLHKINMDNGIIYITGSPTISTDFNLNNGTVYIGNSNSDINRDTVKIKSQLNIQDSLFINGGVVLLESNLNLSNGGFISVANNAKFIIEHNLNQGGDIYGFNNITIKGASNHNSGLISPTPYTEE